ncbi:thioesterase family protein [Nocardia higoensis]|uniref:Thioesterase family protein n=1 Tax=Nocardia higoensis TaxID=228599 RepID=A0ABS0DBV0_9NOCA|nr:acyl-CoA thioesterase domain-containing protein [Nocardia higoensis]MBF6355901.1 thioesterase family protein [Nocardia higoensis]
MNIPPAFFERTDRGFEPLPAAVGAWSPDMVNGPAICGLLAGELDSAHRPEGFVPARLTVDLFRATLRKPLEVTTVEVRRGSRIAVADAQLLQEGRAVARATAVFLRPSEQPPGEVWTRGEIPAPPPAELSGGPVSYLWNSGEDPAGWSRRLGGHQNDQRKRTWQRPFPVILGEEPNVLATVATVGESTSMLTNWGAQGVGFINGDLTLVLSRLPRGGAIGVQAENHFSADGIAVGNATLFDEDGPFGAGVTTAVANPAAQVDFSRR